MEKTIKPNALNEQQSQEIIRYLRSWGASYFRPSHIAGVLGFNEELTVEALQALWDTNQVIRRYAYGRRDMPVYRAKNGPQRENSEHMCGYHLKGGVWLPL